MWPAGIGSGLVKAVWCATGFPASGCDALPGSQAAEQEALDLDVKAAQHSKRAALSAARGRGGSKQATSQSSISKHCERLAKAYRAAAAEARELAKTHREMAQPT